MGHYNQVLLLSNNMSKLIKISYDFQGHAIKNVSDPVEINDVANKKYVDSVRNDRKYIHYQSNAANEWSIAHNLGERYPNVKVINSANEEIFGGEIEYVDVNNLIISFSFAFGGIAIIK